MFRALFTKSLAGPSYPHHLPQAPLPLSHNTELHCSCKHLSSIWETQNLKKWVCATALFNLEGGFIRVLSNDRGCTLSSITLCGVLPFIISEKSPVTTTTHHSHVEIRVQGMFSLSLPLSLSLGNRIQPHPPHRYKFRIAC